MLKNRPIPVNVPNRYRLAPKRKPSLGAFARVKWGSVLAVVLLFAAYGGYSFLLWVLVEWWGD